MNIEYTQGFFKSLIKLKMPSVFREIKWFIQRGKRGYSDQDCWNINSYLCEVISPMIREMKNGTGCPGNLYDIKKKNKECWKWEEILEEIAQGFEAAQSIEEEKFLQFKKNKDGNYENWIDKKKQEQLTKKFDKGISLFVEYFWNLWD